MMAILTSVVKLIVVLICISLIISNVGHLFMCHLYFFFGELVTLHRLKMLHFLILITRKSCGIFVRAAGMHAFTIQCCHNLWVGGDVQTTRALRQEGAGSGYLKAGLYIRLYVPCGQRTFLSSFSGTSYSAWHVPCTQWMSVKLINVFMLETPT